MVIKHLFLLTLFISFNLFGCEKDTINKIVIYTLPMNAMYYGSVSEKALMKEPNKKKHTLDSMPTLSAFSNIVGRIETDSLLTHKIQQLDLRVLMEVHFKKAGIIKIGFNNCGDYIILEKKKVFYRNEELIYFIESNVPQIRFDKCTYLNR